ncbi:MAG: cofactor-independent phosphoglycerate mutase [Planctomycetota bacterium]
MKYVIVIPDGAADDPIPELDGRTPLQAADLPHMDAVARRGRVALSNNTPAHLPAGSEVANLCLLGYDPDVYFTGRAPLEAAAQDILLSEHDWAVRCNLVTVEDQIMRDFTASHISTEEGTALLAALQHQLFQTQRIGDAFPGTFQFVPGVSYRNLLIYRGPEAGDTDSELVPPPFSKETRTSAPHDLTDLSIDNDFPRGPGSDLLMELMNASSKVFADHTVNQQRTANGQLPATNVWLWGIGGAPTMPTFKERFGIQGVIITAVDLLRGIGALAGWPRIEVEGATGYLDTDYAAKGRAAVDALEEYDLVCVHVEAPDEASHEGRYDAKIAALQEIDRHIVGPLSQSLEKYGDYRILVMPDHPTRCSTKKHSHGMVPLAVAGTGISSGPQSSYDETAAAESGIRFDAGWDLMQAFVQDTIGT